MPTISNTELTKLRASIDANTAKVEAVRVETVSQRKSIDALARGLLAVVDTLTNHTSMLKALMVAASPDDDGSPLRDALHRLATASEQQTAILQRIEAALAIDPEHEPQPVASPYANSTNPANVTNPANADA